MKAALLADKTVDASHIDIDTNKDTKTLYLRGTVPTAAQKAAAEQHRARQGGRVRRPQRAHGDGGAQVLTDQERGAEQPLAATIVGEWLRRRSGRDKTYVAVAFLRGRSGPSLL